MVFVTGRRVVWRGLTIFNGRRLEKTTATRSLLTEVPSEVGVEEKESKRGEEKKGKCGSSAVEEERRGIQDGMGRAPTTTEG